MEGTLFRMVDKRVIHKSNDLVAVAENDFFLS